MTKADERNEGHHGTCAQPRNVRCAAAQVCGALAAHGDLALCIELQKTSPPSVAAIHSAHTHTYGAFRIRLALTPTARFRDLPLEARRGAAQTFSEFPSLMNTTCQRETELRLLKHNPPTIRPIHWAGEQRAI